MISEWRFGKDVEESSHDIMGLLAWHLPRQIEEQQGRSCAGWFLNMTPESCPSCSIQAVSYDFLALVDVF
jgi:hypothetical protein